MEIAYTWHTKLSDWKHLLSQFNAKFFYTEAKFTLTELDRTQQSSNEDLNVYMRRLTKKRWIDMILRNRRYLSTPASTEWQKNTWYSWRIYLSLFLSIIVSGTMHKQISA